MNIRVIFLLMVLMTGNQVLSQSTYNNCSNALELCPNTSFSVSNIAANVTFCPGCEDDFNFCFPTDNTIWMTFTTNAAGGDVQVDFSNLIFQMNPGQDTELQATILEAGTPCSSASYVQIGNCVATATANFSLNALALAPSTTYYIVVDGDNAGAGITSPAEASFDVTISGTGVDRPVSSIFVGSSSDTICKNEIIAFFASVTNCPDSGDFYWYINDTLQAVTADTFYLISTLSDGDVITVETTCYSQCPDTVSVTGLPVTVITFDVYAGEDLTADAGDLVNLNGSTTAPDYVWSPGYLFSDPNSLSTTVIPNNTVTVTLSATQDSCTLTDQLTITVNTGLDIPNTFSPNGDGINETWIISGIEDYPNNSLTVMDRWGQKIYQTTSYSELKAWDGKVGGRVVSEGVYFYVLDLIPGTTDLIKGTITIIR